MDPRHLVCMLEVTSILIDSCTCIDFILCMDLLLWIETRLVHCIWPASVMLHWIDFHPKQYNQDAVCGSTVSDIDVWSYKPLVSNWVHHVWTQCAKRARCKDANFQLRSQVCAQFSGQDTSSLQSTSALCRRMLAPRTHNATCGRGRWGNVATSIGGPNTTERATQGYDD